MSALSDRGLARSCLRNNDVLHQAATYYAGHAKRAGMHSRDQQQGTSRTWYAKMLTTQVDTACSHSLLLWGGTLDIVNCAGPRASRWLPEGPGGCAADVAASSLARDEKAAQLCSVLGSCWGERQHVIKVCSGHPLSGVQTMGSSPPCPGCCTCQSPNLGRPPARTPRFAAQQGL